VEENGEILEYVLQEATAAPAAEAAPSRRCFLNGQEIPYETFTAAYERLLTVTFSGRLPDDTDMEALLAKEPNRKYTFRTLSGGTHTVLLRSWDDMHDAVTVDGSTLFYLIKGGMTDLPR
jgi:hypothetical protein